jgi:phosphoenolpyruvate synthase/pyruvate phosphate dikinase
MKELVIPFEEIHEGHSELVGSKAFSLHGIVDEGLKVPPYVCVTTEAYERFLDSSTLRGKIMLELSRKDVEDMRWEEMWDTFLRIRNHFLNTPIPEILDREVRRQLSNLFSNVPVVVRSSAPGEDSSDTSFAGLHDSYVNVRGVDPIMKHIRLVWASLWSDAAFLYREELGLDIEHSSMAVMVQELVAGDVSGIIFSSSPDNDEHMAIEAVHGLNKGLVDGDVEPDRWMVDRGSGAIVQHVSPSGRDVITILSATGTVLENPGPKISNTVPLDEEDVHKLYDIAMALEKRFGKPQDIEWTKRNEEIYVLQSRPITTTGDRKKLWYLSLRRTMDNLDKLRNKVEYELIPEMIRDVASLKAIDIESMNNYDLAKEIIRRDELHEAWKQKYIDEFIPFAHGMRMFGQVYNDVIRPSNPYEFMDLLSGSGLLSVSRNEELNRLAGILRKDAVLMDKARNNVIEGDFGKGVEDFFEDFGHSDFFKGREDLLRLIIELASNPETEMPVKRGINELEKQFISSFSERNKACAEELLDTGRTSYRLRDDDNIHIGRIEEQYFSVLREAKRRIAPRLGESGSGIIDYDIEKEELLKALDDNEYVPEKKVRIKEDTVDEKEHKRQIQGQPAGEGLVTGIARVITKNEELFNIRFGEILVCDAIDPNMTFVVPLVSGIVERRGGMLIHGAIIAREYGIPCVTGIPDATKVIKTGDEVTVDGYLGIVIIRRM